MKLVYIAGPYTGDNYLAVEANIAQAREAAAWLANNGVGYYCPHLNSAHFEAITPDVPIAFWYEMDYRLLDVCDALLVLPGWEKSWGTARELERAQEQNKPVFYWLDDFTGSGLLLEWAS